MKKVYCRRCSELIKEKIFVAISTVSQGLSSPSVCGAPPIVDGWYRRHSDYYHQNCFELMAGKENLEQVMNPKLESKDYDKMQKLAGIK